MGPFRAYLGAIALLAVIFLAIGLGERSRPQFESLFGVRGELTLYFASPDAQRLVPERRRVPAERANPKGALLELIRGPAPGSSLVRTLPPDERLLGFRVQGTLATVDLGPEIRTAAASGTAGEVLVVFSIVNTLTEWSQIKSVRILIDGRAIDTLTGHLELSQPIGRDDGIISGIE